MIETPLYQDLADRLASSIRGGTFPPGDRLPSVRRLSREHGVSISTVIEAYARLEGQGLVEARARSGYFAKVLPPKLDRLPRAAAHAPKPVKIECASIFEAVMDAVADPRVVPFGAAVPDDAIIPHARLASLANAVVRRLGAAAFRYNLPPGRRELRTAVAKRLLAAGIQAAPDEILTTQGATEAVSLALRAVTKPGDLVAVETPTFFGLLHLVRDLGLKVLEIPVCPSEGLMVDALKTALAKHRITACLVQPNFQNPLAGLMPPEAKRRLVALAETHDFTLIEDDLYGDLIHHGERPCSLARYDTTGRVIHCGAVSKTLAPGLRVSWIVPGRHYAEVRHLKHVHNPANSTLSELVVAEFFNAGGYDRHLRRVRTLYARQCAEMRRAVIEHIPEARVNDPRGGFVLWVEMPAGFDAERFAVRAFEEKISLVPGSIFSPTCGLQHCFRLSCGFAFDERTHAAIRTLGRIAKRMS